MRWRVFLTLACVGLLAAPLARADETLQQKYLNIYLKINEAEQMERHADYRGALADFKECYDGLAKINKSDPNWETALVLHRMADCKAKILELARVKTWSGPLHWIRNRTRRITCSATFFCA